MLRLTRSASGSRRREAKILADAVEDDDGVVHGVADQGEDGGDDGEGDLHFGEREGTHRDERVVEAGNDGGHSVDELKPEPQVNEHAEQRVEGGENGLFLELFADLSADDFDTADGEAGNVRTLLERAEDGGIDDAVEFVYGSDDAAVVDGVAELRDGVGLLLVAGLGVGGVAHVLGISLLEPGGEGFTAGVVEVELALVLRVRSAE